MDDLRYPIGKFNPKPAISDEERRSFIEAIAATPQHLREAINGLNQQQLDTPYRPDGWTVRQVIHHLPDSHLNSYIRFKIVLTEDHPTIRTYDQQRWAELPEAKTGPIEMSLTLLESLHHRWVLFLRNLQPSDFARTFNHPENGTMTLDRLLQLYAWHGRHHVAHITSLRSRMGW